MFVLLFKSWNHLLHYNKTTINHNNFTSYNALGLQKEMFKIILSTIKLPRILISFSISVFFTITPKKYLKTKKILLKIFSRLKIVSNSWNVFKNQYIIRWATFILISRKRSNIVHSICAVMTRTNASQSRYQNFHIMSPNSS